MEMDIVTKVDLEVFRMELLNDLKALLERPQKAAVKAWLRNQEVCHLLGISLSTLKRMRVRGGLKATKIGGIQYYSAREIERLLQGEPSKGR